MEALPFYIVMQWQDLFESMCCKLCHLCRGGNVKDSHNFLESTATHEIIQSDNVLTALGILCLSISSEFIVSKRSQPIYRFISSSVRGCLLDLQYVFSFAACFPSAYRLVATTILSRISSSRYIRNMSSSVMSPSSFPGKYNPGI